MTIEAPDLTESPVLRVLYGVALVVSVWSTVAITRKFTDDPTIDLQALRLRFGARMCYRAGYWCGTMGVRLENAYNTRVSHG